MNTLNKLAMVLAAAAVAGTAGAQTVDNWRSADNQLVWKNGTNELCWRDANWTPATAAPGCDGALVPTPTQAQTTMPVQPMPVPAPVAPVSSKVTYAADAFFDFDKSVLKPMGKEHLDRLIASAKGINLEVIIAIGHTDSVGTDAYNQRLSVRRSEAVKAYLVSKGIDRARVFTEGRGESSPVADNSTADGRAKNRRVEIEVVGNNVGR